MAISAIDPSYYAPPMHAAVAAPLTVDAPARQSFGLDQGGDSAQRVESVGVVVRLSETAQERLQQVQQAEPQQSARQALEMSDTGRMDGVRLHAIREMDNETNPANTAAQPQLKRQEVEAYDAVAQSGVQEV